MIKEDKNRQLEELKTYVDQYQGTPADLNVYIHDVSPSGSFLSCEAEEIIIEDPSFLLELYQKCGYIQIALLEGSGVCLNCEILRPSFEEKTIEIDEDTIRAEVVFDEMLSEIEKRRDLMWIVDNNKRKAFNSWLADADLFIEAADGYQISFEVDEETQRISLVLESEIYEIDTINSPLIKVVSGVQRLSIKQSKHGRVQFTFEKEGIWV